MRVGANEGARHPEGDETGNGGRVALKGRKGGMTGKRTREGKGVGSWARNTGRKKAHEGEKNRDGPWRVG